MVIVHSYVSLPDGTIWVNYNNLTVLPSPGIMVKKGHHPQMAAIQVSEI